MPGSLAPPDGAPKIDCPRGCGTRVGVTLVDPGTADERELLVDLGPIPSPSADVLIWVEMFSGHPPRGRVLAPGALHRVHRCE